MIERKKKLILIQISLLIIAILSIYFTYYSKEERAEEALISKSTQEKIKKQNLGNDKNKQNMFYDISYTGLDLSGNRYLLKSEQAYVDETKPEIIYMTIVEATFYFKDGTVLYISSNNGIYNNKTLDMKFEDNVKANYQDSELFAEKANYSNSESYLSIYENVRVNDKTGNLIADKLLFDITNQTLDITAFNNCEINANVKLNEKRF